MDEERLNDKPILVSRKLDDYYLNMSSKKLTALNSIINRTDELNSLDRLTTVCLKKLELFEGYLRNLQNSLSTIDNSKSRLSEDAFRMNTSINNRKLVKDEVRNYLNNLIIDDHLINVIDTVAVGEPEFLNQLYELDKKITIVTNYITSSISYSANNVVMVVDTLKTKAAEKIKENLIHKINMCQNNSSNYSLIQNSMLSLNFFYEFLLRHSPDHAGTIKEHYLQTMQTMYFKSMQVYIKQLVALLKMDTNSLSTSSSSNRAPIMSKNILFKKNANQITLTSNSCDTDFFSINSRKFILNKDFFNSSIVPQLLKESEKISSEMLFHSIINVLYGNAVAEFQFLEEFFKTNSTTMTTNDFDFIFSRCFQFVITRFDSLFNDRYDVIGLLICSSLISRYIVIADSRKQFSLQKFFQAVFKIIWDRVESIICLNIESLMISIDFNDTTPESLSYNEEEDESIYSGDYEQTTSMSDVNRQKKRLFESFTIGTHSEKTKSFDIQNYTMNNDSITKKSFKSFIKNSITSGNAVVKSILNLQQKINNKIVQPTSNFVHRNNSTKMSSTADTTSLYSDFVNQKATIDSTPPTTNTQKVTVNSSNLLNALVSLRGGLQIEKIESLVSLLLKKWMEYIKYLSCERFHVIEDKLVLMLNNMAYIYDVINGAEMIQFPDGFELDIDLSSTDYDFNFQLYKGSILSDLNMELDQTKYQFVQSLVDANFSEMAGFSNSFDSFLTKIKNIEINQESQPNSEHQSDNENMKELMELNSAVSKFYSRFESNWQSSIQECIENLNQKIESTAQRQSIIQSFLNKFLRSYTIFFEKMNIIRNSYSNFKLDSDLISIKSIENYLERYE